MTTSSALELPPHDDREALVAWVRQHLGHLTCDGAEGSASTRFRGGDGAARRALRDLDLAGYATRRNEVSPPARRGATAVSPYVRHGLITLPELWEAAGAAPERDRSKYRDELLWQEYARHLYARIGRRSASDLRQRAVESVRTPDHPTPFEEDLACIARTTAELHDDGWLVNQTRMWLASHWSIRHGLDWSAGEDHFFRHLLDGSRAANRLGWQWTAGRLTGSAYGFSRQQVERRAPGWCAGCSHRHACPIERWPDDPAMAPVDDEPPLGAVDPATVDPDTIDPATIGTEAGPIEARHDRTGTMPELVWLTAESLSARDPARRAHPDLPAVFVFDEPLLAQLRLSLKRLVFLTECLTDPALAEGGIEVHLGDPVEVLRRRRLATTFTPVPGGRRRRAVLDIAVLYPWPWLRRPSGAPVRSFSAWRNHGRRRRPDQRSRR